MRGPSASLLAPRSSDITPLTYGELWDRASRLAGTLVDSGPEPGEFVLAVLPNCWQGTVPAVASSIAGVALSPLAARVSPALATNIFDQVAERAATANA